MQKPDRYDIAEVADRYGLYPKSKKAKAFFYFEQEYSPPVVAYLCHISTATARNYLREILYLNKMIE